MITKAIGDKLSANSFITDYLATYRSNPAVLDVDPVPEDCDYPAVLIRGPVSGDRSGTRGSKGSDTDYDVVLYGEKSYSWSELRQVAWKIWEVLERADFTLEGYESVGVQAAPPVTAPDPDGYPGFRVSVTVHSIKS